VASRCRGLAGVVLAVATVVVAGRAEAQEYCVACTEPTAVYRCVIEGARPGGSQPLQVLCVTTMAKEGRHATCAIKRGTVFECDGPVKRVPWASIEAPQQAKGADQAEAKPEADPNEPPKTIVEMAKRANEQNAQQMKKANDDVKEKVTSTGQAIGDATKKSWDCMISLFKNC
jgi:hypothetical protein